MDDNEKMNEETANQQEGNEKTFTQAEVDEIIRKRLARERRKTETESNTDGEQETGDDREKTLEERELRVMAKEKLLDSGMPSNLADVLRYSDEKSLEQERLGLKEWTHIVAQELTPLERLWVLADRRLENGD